MVKYCIQCNKVFEKSPADSRVYFSKRKKFCSKKCFGDSRKGIARPHSEETKIKIGIGNKNNKTGLENGKQTRFPKTGAVGHKLLGGVNAYRNLHKWVQKELGKPNKCEHCGIVAYGRKIHWASKSNLYKRELSDWLRLCVRCHYNYDSIEK